MTNNHYHLFSPTTTGTTQTTTSCQVARETRGKRKLGRKNGCVFQIFDQSSRTPKCERESARRRSLEGIQNVSASSPAGGHSREYKMSAKNYHLLSAQSKTEVDPSKARAIKNLYAAEGFLPFFLWLCFDKIYLTNESILSWQCFTRDMLVAKAYDLCEGLSGSQERFAKFPRVHL